MIESLDRFEQMLAAADYLFGDSLTAAPCLAAWIERIDALPRA